MRGKKRKCCVTAHVTSSRIRTRAAFQQTCGFGQVDDVIGGGESPQLIAQMLELNEEVDFVGCSRELGAACTG